MEFMVALSCFVYGTTLKKTFTRQSNIIDQYASSGQVTNHILSDQWPTSLQTIEALNIITALVRRRELQNVNDEKVWRLQKGSWKS